MKNSMRWIIIVSFLWVSLGNIAHPSSASDSSTKSALGVTAGVHLRPVLEYGKALYNFNQLVGKNTGILMYFTDWGKDNVVFDPYLLNKIRENYPTGGPVIMLTWQPMNGKAALGCDQNYNAIPLSAISAGKCDTYIQRFAQAIKMRPERFILRLGHEMNITDSLWWPGHFGQDASAYVAMWQHVHQVFTAQGLTNVEWIWSPNYASNPPDAWNDIHNYYPGDAYVDWIGLSGYNWAGGTSPAVPWRSFSEIYDSVLRDLACHYAKPQIIAEIGSVEGSGGKASWIQDAYSRIPTYPFVRAVTWFNDYAFADPSQADFRITTGGDPSGIVNSLGAYTIAYQQAVANSVYQSTLPSLSDATPPQTYCGTGGPVITVNPSEFLIMPGDSVTIFISALALTANASITYQLPPSVGLSGTLQKNTLVAPWDETTLVISSSASTPLGDYAIPVTVNGTVYIVNLKVVDQVYRVYQPLVIR